MYDILLSIADPIGLFGVVIILIAYFLLSIGRWPAESISYQLINFFGALFILFSLFFHWNLSSVVIEVAWMAISLVGIYRVVYKKKLAEQSQT